MTTPDGFCAGCDRPATGFAFIGDDRYCHGDDDPSPTCYMLASWVGDSQRRPSQTG